MINIVIHVGRHGSLPSIWQLVINTKKSKNSVNYKGEYKLFVKTEREHVVNKYDEFSSRICPSHLQETMIGGERI